MEALQGKKIMIEHEVDHLQPTDGLDLDILADQQLQAEFQHQSICP
jgi:hypothetical protein